MHNVVSDCKDISETNEIKLYSVMIAPIPDTVFLLGLLQSPSLKINSCVVGTSANFVTDKMS